jgi:NarL family two-component system sensor histidine kinase LiaS
VEERNRLARDLHDAVKQQIFAAAMQVGAAKALLPHEPTAALNQINEAESLARQAQQELTSLIQELRPAALDNKGLAAALRQLAADWSRQNGIAAEVKARGERPTPLPTEQALFRVAQEALANVARHSRADQVKIGLDWQEAAVTLTVSDNGRGFDPQAPAKGFGLRGMQERLVALGGELEVTSQPGQGATIRAKL